jgi:hypothetical protein
MSLNGGEPGVQGNLVSEFVIRENNNRGKVEILLLDFHFSEQSSPGLWECGNRALAISKGCGKRGKPVFGFPRFP